MAQAIGQIAKVVNQINELQTAIAAAVEQQSATALEISRNVAQVSSGTGQIADNISGVASAAGSTAQGAGVTSSRPASSPPWPRTWTGSSRRSRTDRTVLSGKDPERDPDSAIRGLT